MEDPLEGERGGKDEKESDVHYDQEFIKYLHVSGAETIKQPQTTQ